MQQSIKRTLARVFSLLVFVPFLLGVIAAAALIGSQIYDNARYASNYFTPELDIERIVGSKGTFGLQAFGCTYAIAEISRATARRFKAGGPNAVEVARPAYSSGRWSGVAPWPSSWTKLPYPAWSENVCTEGGAALPCCLQELGEMDRRSIETGLRHTDGWYANFGEHAAFILPEQRFVGLVRYGD